MINSQNIIYLCLVLIFLSCNKENVSKDEKLIKLNVKVSGISFEMDDNFSKQSIVINPSNRLETTTIVLNESTETSLNYIAELTSIKHNTVGNKKKQAGVISQLPFRIDNKYKLIVFDENGDYITERDYTRGSESLSPTIWLESNAVYSFIAVSLNSTDQIPTVVFDGDIQNITYAQVIDIVSPADFLFYKVERILISNTTSDYLLDLAFRHLYAEVTVIVDAEAEGHITELNASIANSYQLSTINIVQLATGKPSGAISDAVTLYFNAASAIYTSNTHTIYPDLTSTISFNLLTILSNVNPLEFTKSEIDNPSLVFNNLNIKPGHEYTFKLNINPDWYFSTISSLGNVNRSNLNFRGYPAVRLKGKYWMLHNLGADVTLDPNGSVNNPVTPNIPELRGNYYQWGRITAHTYLNTSTSNWNMQAEQLSTAWNDGDEENPIKTSNDPCPKGWRVPTFQEIVLLSDYHSIVTINTYTSFGTGSSSNYYWNTGSKAFTSRKNPDVKFHLPASGSRTTSGVLQSNSVGRWGNMWSSLQVNATIGHGPRVTASAFQVANQTDKRQGNPIRCIADMRQNPDGTLIDYMTFSY